MMWLAVQKGSGGRGVGGGEWGEGSGGRGVGGGEWGECKLSVLAHNIMYLAGESN